MAQWSWTPRQEEILRELWPTGDKREIADQIGRTVTACEQRAFALGIMRESYYKRVQATARPPASAAKDASPRGEQASKFQRWTKKDDELLRSMWRNDDAGDYSDLVQALGRTATSIRRHAYDIGLGTSRRLTAQGKSKQRSVFGRARKWTPEEEALLIEKWSEWGIKKLAKKLKRTVNAVQIRGAKLKLKLKDAAKPQGLRTHEKYKLWTQEETEQLRDEWGQSSIDVIAKNHGRSKNAIKERARRLKLGPHLNASDDITLNQLITIICDQSNYAYKKEQWTKAGLPIMRHRVDGYSFAAIKVESFWKWAQKHQNLMNFSRFEENALGAEPAWVKQKRRVDQAHKVKKKVPWSPEEDAQLRLMLSKHEYGYVELAEHFVRSQAAIKRRIYDLQIKDRPVRKPPIKWTKEETETMLRMEQKGYARSVIAQRIGKSEGACLNRKEFLTETGTEWTPKEETILRERWFRFEASEVAGTLNRTETAVRRKARYLRLRPHIDENGTVALREVMQAIYNCELSFDNMYRLRKRWIKAGLPTSEDGPNCFVNITDFWHWAEEHQDLMSFAKFTQLYLGAEPRWAREKRNRDQQLNPKHKKHWSKAEDETLRTMLESYSYSITEISAKLHRTEHSVIGRIKKLHLKNRPNPSRRQFWKPDEIDELLRMQANGITCKEMARRLNRTESSCQRKLLAINKSENEETP